MITICEGELDAMSVSQAQGNKWPVVSIRNGAASALKDVSDNYDFLTSFDTVVICFDNDDAGKKAALRCGYILATHSLDPKIITPPDGMDPDDWISKKG